MTRAIAPLMQGYRSGRRDPLRYRLFAVVLIRKSKSENVRRPTSGTATHFEKASSPDRRDGAEGDRRDGAHRPEPQYRDRLIGAINALQQTRSAPGRNASLEESPDQRRGPGHRRSGDAKICDPGCKCGAE